jgi:pyruvate/2-oxoglutarate dehydrogenase complex dihydrolipoamide dehydrogenase (E3) component
VDEITQKIWVDSQDMTTAFDVYALGDCAKNGGSDSAVCYRAGVKLGGRLYQQERGGGGETSSLEVDDQFIPVFLMTPVQYSCVGLSEEGAVKEYGESSVETYHSRFQPPQYQLGNRLGIKSINRNKIANFFL